jgi:hypothetical protein
MMGTGKTVTCTDRRGWTFCRRSRSGMSADLRELPLDPTPMVISAHMCLP